MRKIRFISISFFLTFLTSLLFAENFHCVDEIRTGLVKEEESWSSKKIKENAHAILKALAIVIKNGMKILGVSTPSKM